MRLYPHLEREAMMDSGVRVCKNCEYFIEDGGRCDRTQAICFATSKACKNYKEDEDERVRNRRSKRHWR